MKSLFLPSRLHFFLYFLISLLSLTFINSQNIWRYFNSSVIQQTNLGDLISNNFPKLHNFLSKIPQARALQVAFWILIGTTLYIVFWFVRNVLNNLRNDLVASEYIHPKNFTSSGYWRPIIVRKAFFGLTSFVLLAFIYSGLKLSFALAGLCYAVIINFRLLHSLLEITLAVLAMTVLIHFFVVLCRVVIHSWQFIYVDL